MPKRKQRSALPDWDSMLRLLKAFVNREGHALVPGRHYEENLALGHWVYQQRRAYREGTLSKKELRSLERLPKWAWDVLDVSWNDKYNALVNFVRKEKHYKVPSDLRVNGGLLNQWLQNQKTFYHSGKLTKARQKKLELLPRWKWNEPSYHVRWNIAYNHLLAYTVCNGHAVVPLAYTTKGFPLGKWVNAMRTKRAKLSKQQVENFEQVKGWSWNAKDDLWDKGYQHLLKYKSREGHVQVPTRHIEHDYRLGAWLAQQRFAFRRGRLSQKRTRRLKKLGVRE